MSDAIKKKYFKKMYSKVYVTHTYHGVNLVCNCYCYKNSSVCNCVYIYGMLVQACALGMSVRIKNNWF